MLTASIRGRDQIRSLDRALRDLQTRQLTQATRRATQKAVERWVPPAVRAFAAATLPRRYAADVVPELRFRTHVKLSSPQGTWVSVTVWARGKARHRDLDTIDAYGRLRHPLFGNRKHWYTTQVRPGFAHRAMDAVRPALVREIDLEWRKVAAKFEATH